MILNKLLFIFQNFIRVVSYVFNRKFNEKKFFKDSLSNNSVVIDIGSNVGTFIKFISKIDKNKNMTIHSFEPIPELCVLQQRIKMIKNHKLIIHNTAVSDIDSATVSFSENIISSQSYITNNNEESDEVKKIIKVKSTNLSDFIDKNKLQVIDILKLDAEGFDYKILKSIEKLLEKNVIKVIKVEIHIKNVDIIYLLTKNGYKLININNLYSNKNQLVFFDAFFKKNRTIS